MKIRHTYTFSLLALLAIISGSFTSPKALAEENQVRPSSTENWIPIPQFIPSPPYSLMVKELSKLARETSTCSPDPIESIRTDLETTLSKVAMDKDSELYEKLLEFYQIVYPEKVDLTPVDPYQEYLKELKRRLTSPAH